MGKINITLSLVVISLHGLGQKEQSLLYKGNELYKLQQYSLAAEQYQKAADINAKNSTTLFNLGNALYKTKNVEGAEKVYTEAAENTRQPGAKSRAYYNKGVSLSKQKKLQESITAYKQTLRLNSTDQQARENLQKALNELKKQPPKQGGGGGGGDDKDKQKQPEPEKNTSKMNQKQVEDKLDMLRKEEKRLQQFVQNKNNTGTPNSKDW